MSNQQVFSGRNFSCTRCSMCCRHESGFVFLSPQDVRRLAAGLGISDSLVVERYCRYVDTGLGKRVSLGEHADFDCIFWREGACSVYEYRPLQCRAYPFWSTVVGSDRDWDAAAADCPGINTGRFHDSATVAEWLRLRLTEPLIELDDAGGNESASPIVPSALDAVTGERAR